MEVRIGVIVDTEKGIARLEEFATQGTKAMQKLERSSESLVSKLKGHWLAISAIFAGAVYSISKAWDMAEMAAVFEEQKASLNALARRYNTTADQIISSIKEVSQGLIAMDDAARIAGTGLMKGLSPKQLRELAGAAETLSNITGEKVPQAFENLVGAIALGKERALETSIGIIDLNARFGEQINKMTDAEKAAARYQIVMERVRDIQEQLGSSTDSINDKMDRLKVTVHELQLTMGTALMRAGLGAMGILEGMASVGLLAAAGIFKIGEAIGWLAGKLGITKDIREEMKAFSEEMRLNAEAAWQAAMDLGIKGNENLKAMVASSEDLAKASGKVTEKLNEIHEASDDIKKLNEEIQKQIDMMTMAPLELIEKQASAWRKAGADRILIEQWVSAKSWEIQMDYENKIMEQNRKRLEQERSVAEARIRFQLGSLELGRKQKDALSREEELNIVKSEIELYQALLSLQKEALVDLKDTDTAYWQLQNSITSTQEKIADLTKTQRELSGTMFQGMIAGAKQYGRAVEDTFNMGKKIASEVTSAMENAFMTFFDYTSERFLKFKELAINILNDIYKALIRALIVQPLVNAIVGGVSNLFSSPAPAQAATVHNGGYIPRFHIGGLASDERLAILQTGEYVVSRKGVEALDAINQGKIGQNINVVVNVQNQTGAPVDAKRDIKFDGENYIINVILKNIDSYGPLRHAIAGVR